MLLLLLLKSSKFTHDVDDERSRCGMVYHPNPIQWNHHHHFICGCTQKCNTNSAFVRQEFQMWNKNLVVAGRSSVSLLKIKFHEEQTVRYHKCWNFSSNIMQLTCSHISMTNLTNWIWGRERESERQLTKRNSCQVLLNNFAWLHISPMIISSNSGHILFNEHPRGLTSTTSTVTSTNHLFA